MPSLSIASYFFGVNIEDAFLFVLLVHAGAWVVINLNLSIKSLKVRKKINKNTDFAAYKGMQYIGISGILLIATLISFVMQEIVGMIPELATFLESINFKIEGCTYFIAIGWILSGFSATCLYVGYLMPGWVKTRWDKISVGNRASN